MKYLISTACNEKFENFLINDWLKSLKDNVDLYETDVLVLDFGLSERARSVLIASNVLVRRCSIPGKIVNTRFVELSSFLKENPDYEQVMMCDSGDLIFQKDISELFKLNPDDFKAVCEDYRVPMDFFLTKSELSEELKKEIKKILNEKKMVNAGVLISPTNKFIEMSEFIASNLKNLNVWGMDQLLINYYLYKNGFLELDKTYNFIPTTHLTGFIVKNGEFYFRNGEKIAVVHNAGNKKIIRPVKNFGYGKNKNKPKYFLIHLMRFLYKTASFFER